MNLTNWYIPDVQPVVVYAAGEVVRWCKDNPAMIPTITTLWFYLKVLAGRSKNTVDDSVIKWISYFLTFKWVDKDKAIKIP